MKTLGLRTIHLSASEVIALLDAAIHFEAVVHYDGKTPRASIRRDNALRRAMRKLQRAAPKAPPTKIESGAAPREETQAVKTSALQKRGAPNE